MRKKSPTPRWLIAALAGFVVVAAAARIWWPSMPIVAWRALEGAETYELLSLNPKLSGGEFYSRDVLGRTMVTDATTRQRLNRELDAMARESNGSVYACFNPRHGIRVTQGNVTTDFVICFECRQVHVIRGGKLIAVIPIGNSSKGVFDEVLSRASVPLAPAK